MTPVQCDVRVVLLEHGEDLDDVDGKEALYLAWPAGVSFPEMGEIVGYEGEPYQVYDRQWNYHITPEGSHLHVLMILGEPDEDE